MSDGQDDFARKISAYLDQGASELRPGIAYRLQVARADALARLPEALRETELRPAYSGTGTAGTSRRGRPLYAHGRFWLAVAVLAAGIFGAQQWSAYSQLQDLEDLDTQILTSDLPIDAYLDRGFQHWVRTYGD
jgi:hypothetical protein